MGLGKASLSHRDPGKPGRGHFSWDHKERANPGVGLGREEPPGGIGAHVGAEREQVTQGDGSAGKLGSPDGGGPGWEAACPGRPGPALSAAELSSLRCSFWWDLSPFLS